MLVEGTSDEAAVRTLAGRRGLDLTQFGASPASHRPVTSRPRAIARSRNWAKEFVVQNALPPPVGQTVGTMQDLSIRTATPADHDAVAGVYRRSSLSNVGDRDNLLAHPESLEYEGTSLDEGRTRVAVVGDQVIGFVTTRTVDDWMELDDLFVDPGWMRNGVAGALVRDVVIAATERCISGVNVTANPHAIPFYESVGFVVDGLVETPFGHASQMHLDVI